MIVIRVELHSAVTGVVTELGRMIIANEGTPGRLRDYVATTLRGRSTKALDAMTPQRAVEVKAWPSADLHVWNLVAAALADMKYGRR